MKFCALGCALLLLLLAGSARAAEKPTELQFMTADGPRAALIYRNGTGPKPTIIVLHGATMTAESLTGFSGFVEAAERVSFHAVFPDGLDKQWNDARNAPGSKPDDVSFLRQLADRLIADGVAVRGKLYVAGVSNGGMMAFTMVCRVKGLFAGLGAVVANMPAALRLCRPEPMPLVMVNGTSDPLMPFDGGGAGPGGTLGQVLGAERTARIFALADRCKPTPLSVPLVPKDVKEATRITQMVWKDCLVPGTSVTLLKVEGGGHQVAGAEAFAPKILGPNTEDISAANAILFVLAANAALKR